MKIVKFILKYLLNVAIAIDQLGNALMFGDPDETISSRYGRRYPNSFFAWFINGLFFWQNNHVKSAIELDRGKDDLLPYGREKKYLIKILIGVIIIIILFRIAC